MGTGSLHASIITGGRELSSYPDACSLAIERRTIARETGDDAARDVDEILRALREEDPAFSARARLTFSRPPYEVPSGHPLADRVLAAAVAEGAAASRVAMSFWTDAAILGGAGIPSVLFGPGGAGLHSTEEYVRIDDVVACRNVLASLAASVSDW
jgi:acetylornithine deacetylase